MRVVFLGEKQLRITIGLFIMAVFVCGIVINWGRITRQVVGVKPGVRLEGRLLSGMLPGEVARVVKAMALKINRDPRNASYFPETGEIIPAESGRYVDIAKSVNRVCLAPPGSSLRLAVNNLQPEISEEFFKPVYHGNEQLPRVALAINVAWGEEYLPEILKILQEEKVKATFFLVGAWVKNFPEMVKTFANERHELANHGSYHGHPLQMNREEIKQLILENETLIKSYTGKKTVNYFAPPYGEVNSLVVSAAAELGFRTIMWSVDSVDWKNPSPETLLDRVLSKIEAGGIILLHPTVSTKESLRTLIRSLRKKGLEPGTVSSVLQN